MGAEGRRAPARKRKAEMTLGSASLTARATSWAAEALSDGLHVAGGNQYSAHRALRLRHAGVGAIGVNLVARKLGLGQLAGDDDGPSGCIHFDGVLEGDILGHQEELLQHFDYVVVGMLIVVEENDVIQGRMFLELLPFLGGGEDRRGGGGGFGGQRGDARGYR